ncbi:hypothetical protein [Halobacterium litoreum]|nr:hypothetical protein [Halobacterium litoreum]
MTTAVGSTNERTTAEPTRTTTEASSEFGVQGYGEYGYGGTA